MIASHSAAIIDVSILEIRPRLIEQLEIIKGLLESPGFTSFKRECQEIADWSDDRFPSDAHRAGELRKLAGLMINIIRDNVLGRLPATIGETLTIVRDYANWLEINQNNIEQLSYMPLEFPYQSINGLFNQQLKNEQLIRPFIEKWGGWFDGLCASLEKMEAILKRYYKLLTPANKAFGTLMIMAEGNFPLPLPLDPQAAVEQPLSGSEKATATNEFLAGLNDEQLNAIIAIGSNPEFLKPVGKSLTIIRGLFQAIKFWEIPPEFNKYHQKAFIALLANPDRHMSIEDALPLLHRLNDFQLETIAVICTNSKFSLDSITALATALSRWEGNGARFNEHHQLAFINLLFPSKSGLGVRKVNHLIHALSGLNERHLDMVNSICRYGRYALLNMLIITQRDLLTSEYVSQIVSYINGLEGHELEIFMKLLDEKNKSQSRSNHDHFGEFKVAIDYLRERHQVNTVYELCSESGVNITELVNALRKVGITDIFRGGLPLKHLMKHSGSLGGVENVVTIACKQEEIQQRLALIACGSLHEYVEGLESIPRLNAFHVVITAPLLLSRDEVQRARDAVEIFKHCANDGAQLSAVEKICSAIGVPSARIVTILMENYESLTTEQQAAFNKLLDVFHWQIQQSPQAIDAEFCKTVMMPALQHLNSLNQAQLTALTQIANIVCDHQPQLEIQPQFMAELISALNQWRSPPVFTDSHARNLLQQVTEAVDHGLLREFNFRVEISVLNNEQVAGTPLVRITTHS